MQVTSVRGIMVTVLLLLLNVPAGTAEIAPDSALYSLGQPIEVVRQLQNLNVLLTERRGDRNRRATRILLAGPENPAKVKAAQIIAGRLGMRLYQIDLSSVVSKYLGETEKNLNRIFTRAAEHDMVLFFDEADALFGERTNINDPRERYTNQESAYLLQKIEAYQGIIIMTSNQPQQLPTTRFDTRITLAPSPPFRSMTSTGGNRYTLPH